MATAASPKIILEIDDRDEIFTVIGTLDGATLPRLVSRDSDSVQFVLKLSGNVGGAHEANEYLAFQLYKAAGCKVPETYLVKDKKSGMHGLLESFIDGVTLYDLMDIRDPKIIELTFPVIRRDLVIHALFANWDINITKNIMIPFTKERTPDYENPITIDCGGTFQFRPMGGIKPYTPEMANIKSIITYAQNYKPMGKFKHFAEPDLRAAICERWRAVDKVAIFAAFDTVYPKLKPIFDAVKRKGLDLDEIRNVLEKRINYLDTSYCRLDGGTRKRKRKSGHKSYRRNRK